MRNLVLILGMFLPVSSFGQEDHLLPADNVFNLYDYQVDYYHNINQYLLKDLADMPEVRVVSLPSFDPESVLSVEHADRSKGTYRIIYVIGKDMIWHNKDLSKFEITRYEVIIDTLLVSVIHNVIKKATSQARYLSDDSSSAGLDGTSYTFSANVDWQGNRFGETWSPREGTKMYQLVQFSEVMIRLATAEKDSDRLKLRTELLAKGEKLLKDLSAP